MSAIPSNITRVPDALSARLTMSNLQKGSVGLLGVTEQLSTGKRINRPSDSPIEASLISGLRSRINASEQRLRNLDYANGALTTLDQSLGDAADIVREALSVGSSQIGAGSDEETRASQAVIIESMLREVQSLSQAQYGEMYVFGGVRTGLNPVQTFLDGFRHIGSGDGLRTEIGGELDIPITLGAERAFGSLSTRIEGVVDLNPLLLRSTELADLRGARTLGVTPGSIEVTIDDGSTPVALQVDLTNAKNMGDVLDSIESAIRNQDPSALQSAYPGGIDVSPFGDRVLVQANVGYTITFDDSGGGSSAADLGLDNFNYTALTTENTAIDLDPMLTSRTQFSALNPSGGFAAGDIVFTNGGRTGTVTVLPSMRISDLVQQVEALGLGMRVEVDSLDRGLQIVNEVSGWNMTVEESGAGTYTATSLGIRSVQGATPGSVFNNGRGIEIAHGEFDPLTGLADPDRNTDFRITLSDGSTFDVDLTPADVQAVQGILDAINAAAGTATPAALTLADFEARLGDGGNGIVLIDNTGGAGAVVVEQLNGHAAEDLGLLDAQFNPAGGGNPATYVGEDRAKVRVGSVFSALTELRTALEGNDVRGISFATHELQSHLDRLVSARAIVGGRGQRVEEAMAREEDRQLLDTTVISGMQDTDFAEASTRFSLLELTQQATYAATARLQSLSLLNFLG
jgi:flagellin-like hook-associated protein FlgL